jgi:hypothetical protein
MVTLVLALLSASCGDLPPRLPTTAAHQHAGTRVGLVTLVVGDRVRADKVRAIYEEMDEVMVRAKTREALALVRLGAELAATDEQTRRAVAEVRKAELDALGRYVDLQMELRSVLTADEFARLEAAN